MSFLRIEDLLDVYLCIIRELSQLYDERLKVCKRPRMRHLLNYLKHRHQKTVRMLEQYNAQCPKLHLKAWSQNIPSKSELIRKFRRETEKMSNQSSMDEVFLIALRMDEMLIDLLKQTYQATRFRPAANLLRNLYAHAIKQRSKLVATIQSFTHEDVSKKLKLNFR